MFQGQLGEIGNRVDDPMGKLWCRAHQHDRPVFDGVGHMLGICAVVRSDRHAFDIESQVVRGFVESWMGTVRRNDLRHAWHGSILAGPVARGFNRHHDAFRAAGGHAAGRIIACAQQTKRPRG